MVDNKAYKDHRVERNMLRNHPDKKPERLQGATPPDDIGSLAWLMAAYQEQLALCQELEEIADSLPNQINRQQCLFAAQALGPLIQGVHHYEEKVLFPWLEKVLRATPELVETLNRLKFEHCEDECFAEELVDTLMRLGKEDRSVNIEATGYMLRGFFEGIRRHIAFEKEHLLGQLSQDFLSKH
jgi:hemerythrin-like domain-containing protein